MRLRASAELTPSCPPGTSPASTSTWAPLQMPSTGLPRSASSRQHLDQRILGGQRAGAHAILVREAARQHVRLELAQLGGRARSSGTPRPLEPDPAQRA